MRVVVVGAGVLGASAAYHLALAGVRTIVVDRAHEGRATAAGAGIICPWSSRVEDPDWYRLSAAGARHYPELAARLRQDGESAFGYRRVGALATAAHAADLDEIEQRVRRLREAAPEVGEVTRLSPAAARALFPPLRDDLAAVHVAGAARVDGRLLAAAMLRGAQKHGAELHHATAELVGSPGRITGVRADGRAVEADAVIVAGGAWAPALLASIGVRLAVEPQRGQITHIRLPGTDTAAWPVVLPPSSHYLLAFDDQRVVVGATRETGSGFDYRVTAAGQAEVLAEALAVAPGLGGGSIIETRIGFRPVGPDIRPLLGAVPGFDGLLVGNGLGAGGLTMGPYAGRLLAQMARGERPEIDPAPYDPWRRGGA